MSGPYYPPPDAAAAPEHSPPPAPAPRPRRHLPWLAIVTFVLTVGTTLVVGIESSQVGQRLLVEVAHGRIGLGRVLVPLLLAGLP